MRHNFEPGVNLAVTAATNGQTSRDGRCDLPFNGWDRQRLWRHLERRPRRAGPPSPTHSRIGTTVTAHRLFDHDSAAYAVAPNSRPAALVGDGGRRRGGRIFTTSTKEEQHPRVSSPPSKEGGRYDTLRIGPRIAPPYRLIRRDFNGLAMAYRRVSFSRDTPPRITAYRAIFGQP